MFLIVDDLNNNKEIIWGLMVNRKNYVVDELLLFH